MHYDYSYSAWQFLDLGYDTVKLFVGDSESWKLNSGCEKIEIEGDYAYVHGVSGSVYRIPAHGSSHMPSYPLSVLCRMMTSIGTSGYKCDLISLGKAMEIVNESS